MVKFVREYCGANRKTYLYLNLEKRQKIKQTQSSSEQSSLRASTTKKAIGEEKSTSGRSGAQDKPQQGDKKTKPEAAFYRDKRGELEIEWDQDAEKFISDMVVLASDPPEQLENKINVLHAYNRTIDERIRRKIFLITYDLMDFVKNQKEEASLCTFDKIVFNRLKPFARFMPPESFESLRGNLHEEYKLRVQIAFWQQQLLYGLQTKEEVVLFQLAKRRHYQQMMMASQSEHKAAQGGKTPKRSPLVSSVEEHGLEGVEQDGEDKQETAIVLRKSQTKPPS
ncbi:MAG: hypothetical protein EZS28_035675 [Streblomastix strix]|uniref:Transcriptional adapter 2-alpha/beta-like domain-containing protein n=1 Tax=Streblomastix strix TaxID=222440 RepID=A0A5J4UEI8_9EUKA|nr:MAG: hypothetical protein EZS28_035675 [Streblomastix strix]